MDYCEICGAPIKGKPYVVFIEGAKLKVCEKCAKKADSVIERPLQPQAQAQQTPFAPGLTHRPLVITSRPASRKPSAPATLRPRQIQQITTVLDENYPQIVKRAREAKGLTVELLAKKLNEKESVIRRIEEGKLRPPEQLVDKLEKELEVKLRTSPPPSPVTPKANGQGLTLRDVAKLKD